MREINACSFPAIDQVVDCIPRELESLMAEPIVFENLRAPHDWKALGMAGAHRSFALAWMCLIVHVASRAS